MTKPASVRYQLLLFGACLAIAASIWLLREPAGKAFSKLFNLNAETANATGAATKPDLGVPVIVSRVGKATNSETIAAIGTAKARRSILLTSEIDGVIIDLPVTSGDKVKAGDTLFQLSTTKAKLAVEIAVRELQEAKRQLERFEYLQQKNVYSEADVDDAKNTVERSEFILQQAKEAKLDSSIRAPFDGVVGIPSVEIGERITTDTQLLSLDQRDEMVVEFEVAERYLSRLSPGEPITGRTPSYAGKEFTGSIEHIDSRVDPTARTIKLRAIIPNVEDELRPGMSFVVEVELPGNEYFVVPELSLQWRKGEAFVWTIEDGKAQKTLVKVINRLNSTILVDGDLNAGQLVVLEGVQRLRPGRQVQYSEPVPDEPGNEQSNLPKYGSWG